MLHRDAQRGQPGPNERTNRWPHTGQTDFDAAEQADPSLGLSPPKLQLALPAKSLSVDVLAPAETLSDSRRDENRIAAAYEDLLAGQAFLHAVKAVSSIT